VLTIIETEGCEIHLFCATPLLKNDHFTKTGSEKTLQKLRENAVSGSESSVLRGVPSVGCAGAVLVRVARSFVRFGSFERCEKTPPPATVFTLYIYIYIYSFI
jgi:hypothetical protein